jgi:hypothetical protein
VTQNVSLSPKFFGYFVAAFDLVEQARRGILENVSQQIESTSVRHGCKGESGERSSLGLII